ncbi:MAG: hypothetical protein ACXWR1_20555 [Bdellovibrionota bacterium]
MKGFGFLTLLLLLPSPAQAGEGSQAFRDAFRSYVKIRTLEEKAKIAEERHDLEEGARLKLTRSVAAELTEARIDFQAFQQPGFSEFSAWEKAVVRGAGPKNAADKTALDFLTKYYSAAAPAWSPVEWQCAGEWFGTETEDSFLKIVFSMEELSRETPKTAASERVLWIVDPFERFLPKAEAARVKAQQSAAEAKLKGLGYAPEFLEVHAFTRLEDQAESLRFSLTERLSRGSVTLVSSGHASAVLLRTLDLNPALLSNEAILGWVNVNGRLFGDATAATRVPSSISKADRQLLDAKQELAVLREERLGRQTPLSPKFPVVNLVSLAGNQRPAASLRDSLLPEGKTFYLRNADGIGALGSALPALGHRAPSGQRDSVSEPGF